MNKDRVVYVIDLLIGMFTPFRVVLEMYLRLFFMAVVLYIAGDFIDYSIMTGLERTVLFLSMAVFIVKPLSTFAYNLYLDYKYGRNE